MLKYEVPVVYDIIMLLCRGLEIKQPPYMLVKRVCAGSNDPSLKKDKFRRYLQLYFEHGLCCHRAKELTPKQQAYYERIRQKKLADYVRQNKDVIQSIRKRQE